MRHAWSQLTAPAIAIEDATFSRQAQVLSSLLLAFTLISALLTIIIVVAGLYDAPTALHSPDVQFGLLTIAATSAAYGLSRTRYYAISARLAVVIFFIILHAHILSMRGSYDNIFLVIIPIILSALFHSISAVVILATGSVGTTLLFIALVPRAQFVPYMLAMVYTSVVTTMIIILIRHRALLENERQSKLERANAALQESEARWRSVVENAPALIINTTRDGTIAFVNQVVTKGIDDVLGKSIFDLAPSHQHDTLERVIQHVLSTGEPTGYEAAGMLPDGSSAWLSTLVGPIECHGQVTGLTFISTDTTERKRTEGALRRYAERLKNLRDIDQTILAARSPRAIAQAALDRLVHLVPHQRATVALFDLERQQISILAGHNVGPIHHFPLKAFRNLDALRQGQTIMVDDLNACSNRSKLEEMLLNEGMCTYVGVPLIAQEELIGTLNLGANRPHAFTHEQLDIVREVTNQLAVAIQQARLHEQVRLHAAELEQRVAERTAELSERVAEVEQLNAAMADLLQDLQTANQNLEQTALKLHDANQELESFAYSVSHDLRAPLRAIAGFSGILLEDYAPQLPPEAQGYLDRVRDNAQRMGDLIDSLLTFSRLGRQALKQETIDLAELVHQALEDLKDAQQGRQVDISIGDLPPCQGDPTLLKQVLINLLSNALKFTRRREVAHIEIGCQETSNDKHVYFVKDNGAGFDMQYADKLFGVFQRLHHANEYEGTGVGLAIVQRIIHRHGGRVWAEAKADRGATFFFTL